MISIKVIYFFLVVGHDFVFIVCQFLSRASSLVFPFKGVGVLRHVGMSVFASPQDV